MVSTIKAGSAPEAQKEDVETSGIEIVVFFGIIFKADIRFRIVAALSNREGACLGEIARTVGISHKNLAKYLETLEQKGILQTYPVGTRNKGYKLSPKYDFLRQFLR